MLTPKEAASSARGRYPAPIEYSALCEAGLSSEGAPAVDATVAFGWKPVAVDPAKPLCDPTNHYLLTVRKAGTVATVWKQDAEVGTFTVSATTYAGLVSEALAAFAGSDKGYYSRLAVVESALDFTAFYAPSGVVAGLWMPWLLYGLKLHTLLDFSDAANPGNDVCDNGNHWTLPGAVQTTDTPTDNHATINPLKTGAGTATLGDGNTSMLTTDSLREQAYSTLSMSSRKWYIEIVNRHTDPAVLVGGVISTRKTSSSTSETVSLNEWFYGFSDVVHFGGVPVDGTVFPDIAGGGVMGLEFDADAGTLAGYCNGELQYTIENIPPGSYHFTAMDRTTARQMNITMRFREETWDYTPSEGFRALSSAGLEAPAVCDSSRFADVVLRTGTGGTAAVSGLGFRPGFVLSKDRDNSRSWALFDSVRGPGKYLKIDVEAAEAADGDSLTGFALDGYTLGGSSSANHAGAGYVDVCLKADPAQGFEAIRYTGDGVAGRKVAHNFGRPPCFVMAIRLDTAQGRLTYNRASGATVYQHLETANSSVASPAAWNNTEPDSSFVTLGTGTGVNALNGEYVLYVFAESDVVKFVEYRGTGSANGPFVDVGGRVKALLFLKNVSSDSRNWSDRNVAANPVNPVKRFLKPNSSEPEMEGTDFVFTSTGFKVASTSTAYNESGKLHIGLALMESSSKYNNAF
ncbi:DUF7483 domain-containing protein [Desulfovibrio sp. Fe33]|uniref:DUF7483 domain-containing protein n=1 Tax=Desulfovibrio sp. Fe33 TaxID=3020842 RepID=UPI00234D539D|nr:hypothetical protein [Desulfovibrio sp. Fe33]